MSSFTFRMFIQKQVGFSYRRQTFESCIHTQDRHLLGTARSSQYIYALLVDARALKCHQTAEVYKIIDYPTCGQVGKRGPHYT